MWAIKKLDSTDYFAVKRLFQEVFDLTEDTYLASAWRKRTSEKSLGVWHSEGPLLAAAIVRGNFLEYIFVSPHAQGEGLGTILLQHVMRLSPAIHLTPVNDDRVIRWYERHGFQLTRRDGDRCVYSRRPWILRSTTRLLAHGFYNCRQAQTHPEKKPAFADRSDTIPA